MCPELQVQSPKIPRLVKSPPPGDLPDPGIKPVSLASPALAGGLFISRAAQIIIMHAYNQFSRETFARHNQE